MRVMVTGGDGYIGGVIVDALITAGHTAVSLDHHGDQHGEGDRARENEKEGVTRVRADVRDRGAIESALREHQIDAVIHTAARSVVAHSVTAPSLYWDVNVTGTLTLLDAMLAQGVKTLVFSSSAAVYDPTTPQPMRETSAPRPVNPYGDTKLAAERAIEHYRRAYGLRAVALRYFNVAGATSTHGECHEPETHIIPRAFMAITGALDALTVNGTDWPTFDGTCVRDYVHVRDVARANLLALGALAGPDEIPLEYNIASASRGYSVREVIDCVTRVAGRSPRVLYGPRREGDPAVLVADCSRAREVLGWSPSESELEAMVESAWRWWSANHPV